MNNYQEETPKCERPLSTFEAILMEFSENISRANHLAGSIRHTSNNLNNFHGNKESILDAKSPDSRIPEKYSLVEQFQQQINRLNDLVSTLSTIDSHLSSTIG